MTFPTKHSLIAIAKVNSTALRFKPVATCGPRNAVNAENALLASILSNALTEGF